MNEKPVHLPTGFDEALKRLIKAPKKARPETRVDYKKRDGNNETRRGKTAPG